METDVHEAMRLRKRKWRWRKWRKIVALFVLVAVVTGSLCVALIMSAGESAPVDTEPPTIVLNGAETITIKMGAEYEELGATAEDNGEPVEVAIEGAVDTGAEGIYNILYIATDAAGNEATVGRTVRVVESRGTIYLTFDDGPSEFTAGLLDMLAKYDVKATFFVTCRGDDAMILREYNEGHAVALHTCSHNYASIYTGTEAFWADMTAVQDRVERITGFKSFLMRFPGGSSNTVSRRYDGGRRVMSTLVNEAAARGFTYFDWNVDSKDAGGAKSADEVFANVTSALKVGGNSVVLQHDVKDFSVAAVERIIQYGLENKFFFEKLDANSFSAHHGVNN